MNIKDIKIDDELKNLLPALSGDELKGLEEDINKHGVLDPIILWNGFIADGHNRYSICKKLGITSVDTKELHKNSKAEVMEWIIDHQFARRNLSKSETVRSLAKVEQEYKKEAKERQSAAGGDRKSENAKIGSGKFTTSDYGRTSEKMAEKIGVSEKTYRNMRTIVNEGTPEQIERMDKGGKGNGVSAIAAEIKNIKSGIPEGHMKCRLCGKIKPIKEFTRFGRDKRCATCEARYNRELYARKRGDAEEISKIEDVAIKVKADNYSSYYAEQDAIDEIRGATKRFVDTVSGIIKDNIVSKKIILDELNTLIHEIGVMKNNVEKI